MTRPVDRSPAPVRPPARRTARVAAALVAGAGLLLGLPLLAIGTVATADGHSQLILSEPAAGAVVPVSPTQISLVFSEPIEASYSSLDLIDPTGVAILTGAGAPDPNDPDVLTADLPAALGPGSYTVNWTASSAADGHDTTGFFVFGVGPVSLGGATQSATGSGSLHPGHDSAHAAAEIQGKVAGYGGVMIAFGLALLAVLVLGPGLGRIPRGAAYGAGVGLVAAAAGCLVLIVVGATGVTTTGGPPANYLGYATGSRAGVLLSARLVLGLAAGLAAITLARSGRPSRALAVAGIAASAEIGLIAAGSHAAAFSSPLPVVVDIVHVGSASLWLAGIVALGALTDFGGRTRLAPDVLRDLVRRFSAIALVSIALLSATGVYAAWIEIGDFTAIRTAYDVDLAVKVAVFLAAVAVGALNYLDGGRDRWLGGLSKRLLLELCLAIVVVVVAANLTSGSPTGTDRPVAIAPSQVPADAISVDLAIQPGRPGPNRYVVTLPAAPGSSLPALSLSVTRTDGGASTTTLPLRADPGDPSGQTRIADVDDLPAGSSWTGTIVATSASGAAAAGPTFAFALDATGISAGRATPPLDPILIVALVLLLGGVLGAGASLAGRSLPRTRPETSRIAVLGGSVVGAVLGLALLVGGPPR